MSQTNTTADRPVFVQPLRDDAGSSGSVYQHIFVHGYWSNVIEIHAQRRYTLSRDSDEASGTWVVSVSHSSGGRDDKQVVSDIEAEENFARALTIACHTARSMDLDRLEKAYQAAAAAYAAERAEERKAQEQAAAADVPLGKDEAGEIIASAGRWAANHRGTGAKIRTFNRGAAEATGSLEAKVGKDHVLRFFQSSVQISREKAIEFLATQSIRSSLVDTNNT